MEMMAAKIRNRWGLLRREDRRREEEGRSFLLGEPEEELGEDGEEFMILLFALLALLRVRVVNCVP